MNKLELNFIPDKEINLTKSDLLGAKPYVDSLKEIINSSDTPFTIGLFGGWGIGKSSVVKTLEDFYNDNDKSNVSVFTYDAWKYSKDSFRRTFNYELKQFYKLETSDDYDAFYEDKHEEVNHKVGIKKGSFMYWVMFIPLLLLLVWLFPGKTDLKVSVSVISGIMFILTTLMRESFLQYKISVSKSKIFAPEQFEQIFKEAVKEITKTENKTKKWIKGVLGFENKEIEKLVIVIDNIDRCHKDLAFELLLTIKNFLEQKGVIFILPIDENEIKKHITKQGHNPNEFLRKLFSTTLVIKKISEGDLFNFAKGLNTKYKLKFQTEVISIVSQEFSKNPRKIIQFLNVLQTERLLAIKQEGRETIPNEAITKNLPVLTKILIIREEWPEVYEVLNKTPYLLNNFYTLIEQNNDYLGLEISEEHLNFFRRTEHIKPNHSNYELFFINRDFFKDVPDTLNKYVESSDFENIKKLLVDSVIEFSKLIEFVDSKFETALKRREINTSVVNIISLIFKLSLDGDYKSNMINEFSGSGKFLGGIKNFLNSTNIDSILLKLDESILIKFIYENDEIAVKLRDSVIRVINGKEDSKNLLQEYLITFKESGSQFSKLSKKTSELIIEDEKFFEAIKDIFEIQGVVEKLLESSLIDNIIPLITNDPFDTSNKLRTNIVKIYHDNKGLSDGQLETYITKLNEHVNVDNSFETQPVWYGKLLPLIKDIEDEGVLTNTYNIYIAKCQNFWNSYASQLSNIDFKHSLFELLKIIREIHLVSQVEEEKKQIKAWLANYYSKSEIPELTELVNSIYKSIINHYQPYSWPFAQAVITKFQQVTTWELKEDTASVINLMISKTTSESGLDKNQLDSIFRLYYNEMNGSYNNEIIEWYRYAIKNQYLFEQLLLFTDGLLAVEKADFIKLIDDYGDREVLAGVIKEILDESEDDELDGLFQHFKEVGVSITKVKKGVKRLVDEWDSTEERLEVFAISVFNAGLIDKTLNTKFIDMIKNNLVSDDFDKVLIALRIIDIIGVIDERKAKAVNTLVNDINVPEDRDSDIIKRVKKKLKGTKK